MTWNDWSDYKVNKLIAEYIYPDKIKLVKATKINVVDVWLPNGGIGFYKHEYVDYCNNPSDMWPIMMNYAIGTISESGKLIGATTSSQQYYEPYGDIVYSYDHHKPLRAAAIVFLMIKGVKPDERI